MVYVDIYYGTDRDSPRIQDIRRKLSIAGEEFNMAKKIAKSVDHQIYKTSNVSHNVLYAEKK